MREERKSNSIYMILLGISLQMKENRTLKGEGDDYISRMLLFFIPYFVFNMLDLVTTKIALATAGVRELNPFYHLFPFAEHFKIFAPLILFSLYVLLYIFSRTEEGKKAIGESSLRCLMALSFLYFFICINNLCQWWLAMKK